MSSGRNPENNDKPDPFLSSEPVPANDFELPDLKQEAKYGVYLWWPQEGDDWIHPDDVETCKSMIPGNRVFRREEYDSVYSILLYADFYIRVKPTMWLEVESDLYEVNDQIEVRSQMGRYDPRIGVITEMRWERIRQKIIYEVRQGEQIIGYYDATQIQPAMRLDEHLDERRRRLLDKYRLM
ncbi:MAG: hypothetical protein AAF456_08675 [Planctomycetota bacterium]